MERPARRLLWFFVVIFLLLVGQLTYVQVFAAPSLGTNAYNTRGLEAEMRIERGLILTADAGELAVNRKEGPYFFRDYPLGALTSPWLGYNSLRYGRSGIERVYNPELSGQIGELAVQNFVDLVTGRPKKGADLLLTVDLDTQKAAASALGDRKGAVVALDPRTGAVLAMVSYPRFDPNTIDTNWQALTSDPGKPLFDRALQGRYPPGSVFKVVVAAAGLQEGVVTPDSPFDDEGSWLVGGYRVNNFGGNVYGEHDFASAVVRSINTTFAKVGVELGADRLARYAEAFGLGGSIPWGLGGSTGSFPAPGGMDDAHVAQVSFGQGELLVSPMGMALITAGIANGGTIMRPYVVQEVRDYNGRVVDRASPRSWLEPIDAATAAQLRALMVKVVSEGTGTRASIEGVNVAGKTGTAEVAEGDSHAWFIGFAPAEDPRIAVAVLVENGGTGGAVAAPIAREVIRAALAN
jgi:peptidoglycan glycosyltransferase